METDGDRCPEAQGERTMTEDIGTERNPDGTSARALSRRAMLGGVAAAALAATGLERPANAFADAASIVTPFTYRAPQSALDDLKRRLTNARWPERETVSDWSQGVPLAKLRALVEYWRTGYEWRRCEKKLKGFSQYSTKLGGLYNEFLHDRSLPQS